jgi:hypothetical protein
MKKNLVKNVAICCFLSWLLFWPVPEKTTTRNQSQQALEIISLRGGSKQSEVDGSVDNLDKKKIFRKILAKHFPDWEARLEMEKHQARIYSKAAKKLKEYQKLSPFLKNHEKWLTEEEKFALDYFHGRGIYKKYQPPNVLDTRQTFLKKMENQEMREKFLENYNRLNPIKEN